MITEKIKKIASVVMTVAIICTTPTVAFAANKTIHIPRLGAGYKKLAETRTGKYGNVRAICHSAWKNDEPSKVVKAIRFDLKNTKDVSMFVSPISLIVGNEAGTYSIDESMMIYKNVNFCFCTIGDYSADTNVGYNPR